MKLAAFDLGSNTIKVTFADHTADEGLQILGQRAKITRIGEGLDTHGRLLDTAMERTFRGLSRLVAEGRELGIERMTGVATAGMRGAANAPEFLTRIRDELGLYVEIIDGLREAELAFRAPSTRFGPGPLLVVDVGGRSTELIAGRGAEIDHRASLEIGSVRLTEKFIRTDPPPAEDLILLRQAIRKALSSAPAMPTGGTLVGVSGTILSLLGVQQGADDIDQVVKDHDGGWLFRSSVEAILADFAQKTTEERIRGSIVPRGRADVIVAGTAIVLEVLDHGSVDRMRVTDQGVRYGLLFEMITSEAISP